MSDVINISNRLKESARRFPFRRAVVFPAGRDRRGLVTYTQFTFKQMDHESDRLARGLQRLGVVPGTRLVLMVRPSLEFIALTFGLFKVGAVAVLIDPGMGRSNIFRCLEEVEPDGFVAIPVVQAIRKLSAHRFLRARFNVTVGGHRWFWGGATYEGLLGEEWTPFETVATRATDPAAIIFTSGSTGPPKGVLYEHGMFDAQVDLLRDFYDIQPGEIDLPGFPLFALFNSAMGITTVIPDMDPAHPAEVNPQRIVEAIRDQGVTQAFGSPAIWNRVGRYCEAQNIRLPSLKRVLSAGAPVPIPVIERLRMALRAEDADIHTPYGATESLPIASISGTEVIHETAEPSRRGAGTCVGHLFQNIHVKIIDIVAGPVRSIDDVQELPNGQIGEIIVQGPVVTREYFHQPEATALAKIPDGDRFWHRMGDVGYRDDRDRLWFCGRKAHIVETAHGRLFTIPCEAIFNEHQSVYRSALVGVGQNPNQKPVVVIEPEPGQFPQNARDRDRLLQELRELARSNTLTERIETFLFHPSLPVDIRHNVKIFREKLAVWAERELK